MTRNKFVSQMQQWIGRKEADGSHKAIIDIYNSHKPLARGYKVKYTDSWCATTVSACAIATGMTDIVPLECSCEEMIKLAKAMGIWEENDAYIPNVADIILYDWQDTGKGDNVGWADHIGVVEKCDGKTITVIEGNINDAVGRRTLSVNGRYVRGYICPKFEETPENNIKTEVNGEVKYFELLQEMNMRATPNGTLITTIPAGKIIQGTELKATNSVQWLYTTYDGKSGYVAVLPESRKYAKEIEAPRSQRSFRYAVDSKGSSGVSGWLYDGTDKEYEIHAYITHNGVRDGWNSIYANRYREDLKNAGIGNGKHGFSWDIDLYSAIGAGNFDIDLYAITEDGANPRFYTGKITVEQPVQKPVEQPAEDKSDKTAELKKEVAALKAKLEQIKSICE